VGSRMWIQYLNGAYKQDGDGLFMRSNSKRTRGNDFELKEGRFRLDVRRKFFTQRAVRHWQRLPREAVQESSLQHISSHQNSAC